MTETTAPTSVISPQTEAVVAAGVRAAARLTRLRIPPESWCG